MSDEPVKTPLMLAVEARKRRTHTFDAGQCLLGDMPGAIAVRLPTVGEEIDGLIWAARHAANNAGAEVEVSRVCNTTLETLFVLCAAIRDASDPDNLPALGNPAWMKDRFTGVEIERMLAILGEVRAREQGRAQEFSEDETVGLAETLANCDPASAAEFLIPMDRDQLIQALRQMSLLWVGLVNVMAGGADEE